MVEGDFIILLWVIQLISYMLGSKHQHEDPEISHDLLMEETRCRKSIWKHLTRSSSDKRPLHLTLGVEKEGKHHLGWSECPLWMGHLLEGGAPLLLNFSGRNGYPREKRERLWEKSHIVFFVTLTVTIIGLYTLRFFKP